MVAHILLLKTLRKLEKTSAEDETKKEICMGKMDRFVTSQQSG
jgi:hypothetical protein